MFKCVSAMNLKKGLDDLINCVRFEGINDCRIIGTVSTFNKIKQFITIIQNHNFFSNFQQFCILNNF